MVSGIAAEENRNKKLVWKVNFESTKTLHDVISYHIGWVLLCFL